MDASVALEEPRSPTSAERWLALGLAAVALAGGTLGFSLDVIARQRGTTFTSSQLGEIGTFSFIVTVVILGVLLRWRRPDHSFGWLLLGFGVVVGTSTIAWSWMLVSMAPGGDAELGAIGTWIGGTFAVPAWTAVITAMIVRFPTGRAETPLERTILRWIGPAFLIGLIASALRPGPIVAYPAFDNPLPLPVGLTSVLLVASSAGLVVAVVPAIASALAMVARYRRSPEVERLQLRWFAFAATILMIASIGYLVLGILLYGQNTAIREISYSIFSLSMCGLPIAIFIAITRHRLYDIDTIISRTVVFAALTAILAGLYAASVRGFNALFVAMTGESSEAALVLTTLVLATTFTPIKSYLERIAAKRFPATPLPALATAAPEPLITVQPDDLDARIEAIARRVAGEMLSEREPEPTPGAPVER